MIVNTFYEPIPGRYEQALIDVWHEAWTEAGWEPRILDSEDADSHPMYQTMAERVEKLPSVNGPSYDFFCYIRWLAMANNGGGLLTDYDVLPLGGFAPSDIHARSKKIICFDKDAPCAVWGDSYAYIAACRLFMDYKLGALDKYGEQPHTSDMLIIRRRFECGLFVSDIQCKEYKDAGWQQSKLVHFPAAKCGTSPKIVEIEKAMRVKGRTLVKK